MLTRRIKCMLQQQGIYPTSTIRRLDIPSSPTMYHASIPSGSFSEPGTDPAFISPTSSQWPASAYTQYHSPSPTQHTYSPHSRHNVSAYTWEPQHMNVTASRGDLTTDTSHPIHDEAWSSGTRAAGLPHLASMQFVRPSEGPTLPTVRTQDTLRTGSSSSTWGWDATSPIHPQLQLSPSQRSAHRMPSSTDHISRYSAQQR